MTRRQFGAGVGTITLAHPHAAAAATNIDQNPIRRRGTGLRGFDPSRASPGFTLFAPASCDGAVYLIDLKGRIVHTWRMPHPPGQYGYPTEKGALFYNGKSSGKILWTLRPPVLSGQHAPTPLAMETS